MFHDDPDRVMIQIQSSDDDLYPVVMFHDDPDQVMIQIQFYDDPDREMIQIQMTWRWRWIEDEDDLVDSEKKTSAENCVERIPS